MVIEIAYWALLFALTMTVVYGVVCALVWFSKGVISFHGDLDHKRDTFWNDEGN